MADIFLSYNREDQAIARQFAERFEAEGLTVWWDATLRSGEAYDEVTEKALNEAKAVVVLWSPRSVDSRWVRAEATQGQRNKTLVPAMIEDCKRPIMFELTQTADLSHWKGDAGDPAWQGFLSDIRGFIGSAAPELPLPRASQGLQRWARPASIAAASVLLVATIGFILMPRENAAPTNQRTAFFGFTADSDDPTVIVAAKSATDETFQAMNGLRLETTARAETRGVALDAQLVRAAKLEARYALGGEVRSAGNDIIISIQLADVPRGVMLWEESFRGGPAESISLPVRAATSATGMVGCFTRFRTSLPKENEYILGLLTDVCRGRFSASEQNVRQLRELAALAPDSAFVHGMLGLTQLRRMLREPATEWPGMLAEAEAATQKALRLDPSTPEARQANGYLLVAKGPLVVALDKSRPDFDVTRSDLLQLMSVGRFREAIPGGYEAVKNDPLNSAGHQLLGASLASGGQPDGAVKVFSGMNARLPSAYAWEHWLRAALFEGAGDPAEVLDAAPPSVTGDLKDCWEAIINAAASTDQKKRRAGAGRLGECVDDGIVESQFAITVIAALGDVDSAFERAKEIDRKNPILFLRHSAWLLAPTATPMQKDKRFLPLMQRLGVFQYWIDTGTRPDLCDTERGRDVEVCRDLRAAQANRTGNR